jgi:hypothetical protein
MDGRQFKNRCIPFKITSWQRSGLSTLALDGIGTGLAGQT